jgi:cell division septum initiation protein DivIVA
MSEADLRANQHQPHPAVRSDTESLQPNFAANGGFEPIDPHPTDTPTFLPEQSEEDWQTVDFPNAISVDAIPTNSETNNLPSQTPTSSAGSPSISDNLKNLLANSEQAKSKGSTPVTLMQALHECNRDLLQRIAQLETALEASQKNSQARETLLEQRNVELQNTQEQLTRLFGKLEVSNQTLQGQEISVESLTNQLVTSQTRLATVERECASIMQRYNEQLHQLTATENVCRELRSRLHRQQRHTLQFKAALEKSLEMPQLNSIASIEPFEHTEDTASAQLNSLLAAVNSQNVPLQTAFNATPVQPWSDRTPGHPETASEESTNMESEIGQELNTLTAGSGILLQKMETYYHQESTTDSPRKIVEPQLPIARSEPEIDPVTLGSQELALARAAQILSSVETAGIQEVRFSAAKPTTVAEPDWLASIATPRMNTKKRRSLAEIELPSFR